MLIKSEVILWGRAHADNLTVASTIFLACQKTVHCWHQIFVVWPPNYQPLLLTMAYIFQLVIRIGENEPGIFFPPRRKTSVPITRQIYTTGVLRTCTRCSLTSVLWCSPRLPRLCLRGRAAVGKSRAADFIDDAGGCKAVLRWFTPHHTHPPPKNKEYTPGMDSGRTPNKPRGVKNGPGCCMFFVACHSFLLCVGEIVMFHEFSDTSIFQPCFGVCLHGT